MTDGECKGLGIAWAAHAMNLVGKGVEEGVGPDKDPRRSIDLAFKMTEQLVGAANELAQRITKLTENALEESEAKARVRKEQFLSTCRTRRRLHGRARPKSRMSASGGDHRSS
ncbi:MAG: hypothetical protein ABSG39_11245 [Acidimicrobiales bacterium]